MEFQTLKRFVTTTRQNNEPVILKENCPISHTIATGVGYYQYHNIWKLRISINISSCFDILSWDVNTHGTSKSPIESRAMLGISLKNKQRYPTQSYRDHVSVTLCSPMVRWSEDLWNVSGRKRKWQAEYPAKWHTLGAFRFYCNISYFHIQWLFYNALACMSECTLGINGDYVTYPKN